MVTVCLNCGGSGFEMALDKCHKCQNYAVHRYCRKVLPKDLSEDTIWHCEDCEPDVANQCELGNPGSAQSGFSASAEPDKVQSNRSMRKFKKNQSISNTTSESEMEEDSCESSPPGNKPQCREEDDNDRSHKKRRILHFEEEKDEDRLLDASEVTAGDLRPLKNSNGLKETIVSGLQAKTKDDELLCKEKCHNDTMFGLERSGLQDDELLCTNNNNNNNNNAKRREQRKLVLEDEEIQHVETSGRPVNDTKPADVLQHKLVASSGAKTEVQIRESKCSVGDLQCGKMCDNDTKLGEQRRLVLEEQEVAQPLVTSRVPVSDVKASNILQQKLITASEAKTKLQIQDAKHSGVEPQCRKKSDKDQKLRKQQRLVIEELAEPLKASRAAVSYQKSQYLLEQRVISSSVAKPKALDNSQPSCTQCREKCYRDKKFKEQPRLRTFSNIKPSNILRRKVILEKIHDSRPSGAQHTEKLGKDQQSRKQRRLILEEDVDEFLGTSQLPVNDPNTSDIVKENVNTGSAAKTKMPIHASGPSGCEPQCTEKCGDDMKLEKQSRLVHDGEEVKSLKTSSVSRSDPKPSYNLQKKFNNVSEAKTQIHEDRRSDIDPELGDRHDKDRELRKQKGLVLEGGRVEPLKTSRVSMADVNCSKISEFKVAPGSVDKPKARIPENKPSGILDREKYDKDQMLRKEQKMALDDEVANPSKTSQVPVKDAKTSNISQTNVIISGSVARLKMLIVDGKSAHNEPQHRDKYNTSQQFGEKRRIYHVRDSDTLNISQQNVISCSIDKLKVQVFDSRSACNELSRRECDMDQNLREKQRNSHVSDPKPSNMSQQNAISGFTEKMNVRMSGGRPFGNEPQRREHCDNDQQLGDRRKMSHVSDPQPSDILQQKTVSGFVDKMKVQSRGGNRLSGDFEPQCMEKHDKDQKFREQQTLLCKEGAHSDCSPSNISEHIFCDPLPMEVPVWKGTLRIANEDSDTVNRILATAHLSTLANSKAFDVAESLPECVFLETFSRLQLWPECFQNSGPSCHHIALYFFPDRRAELFFDRLIDKMHHRDLAMRAVYEHAELLVFPSYVLPMNCRMLRSKYFLWGVFRSKQDSSSATVSKSHPPSSSE